MPQAQFKPASHWLLFLSCSRLDPSLPLQMDGVAVPTSCQGSCCCPALHTGATSASAETLRMGWLLRKARPTGPTAQILRWNPVNLR